MVEIAATWFVLFSKAALFGFIAGVAVGAIAGLFRDSVS